MKDTSGPEKRCALAESRSLGRCTGEVCTTTPTMETFFKERPLDLGGAGEIHKLIRETLQNTVILRSRVPFLVLAYRASSKVLPKGLFFGLRDFLMERGLLKGFYPFKFAKTNMLPPLDRLVDFTCREGNYFFIARMEGELVGTIAFQPAAFGRSKDTAYFRNIYVSPGHQGKGVARTLETFAMSKAKALGYRSCVAVTNPWSLPIFLNMGWRLSESIADDPLVPKSMIVRAL